MKKQLKILVLFFMVWAPLGAQTFEKTIPSSTMDHVFQIIVNDNDEVVLFITAIDQHSLPNYNFSHKNAYTKLLVLDKYGQQVHEQKISSYDFNPTMDSSIASFHTYSGVYYNHQYLLSGTSKIDTPLVYTNVIFILDSNFSIVKYKVQDTTASFFTVIDRLKFFNNKLYTIGERRGLQYPYIREGLFAAIDDSLELQTSSLFDTNDSLFLRFPNDFLIDDKKHIYIFGEGTLPNMGAVSDYQLIKTNIDLKLIKKSYIHHPLLSGEVRSLLRAWSNSFWISDSTFLLTTSGETGINGKGDIHLFVYDTNFQQHNYKRIINWDSTAFNFTRKSAVYDRIYDCYYKVVTWQHKKLSTPIFGSNDTTDFQLIKLDKDLNVLFQRNYRRNKTMTFNTLTTDSKGNVIMAGMIQDINTLDIYDTDIFILKVDSLGNLNHLTGVNQSSEIEELNYQIYPNPSSGMVNFIQYNLQETYEMKVYNSQGSLMGTYSFKNADNHFDISNFANGVYVYTLKDSKGRTSNGKIIKQD